MFDLTVVFLIFYYVSAFALILQKIYKLKQELKLPLKPKSSKETSNNSQK